MAFSLNPKRFSPKWRRGRLSLLVMIWVLISSGCSTTPPRKSIEPIPPKLLEAPAEMVGAANSSLNAIRTALIINMAVAAETRAQLKALIEAVRLREAQE